MEGIEELLELLLGAQTQAPRTVLELPEAAILELCSRSRLLLLSQPVLAELVPPLKICGDIHGQYTDLLRLFEMGGFPSAERPYLFLGDYVDRAQQSIETACLLLCYKLKFPEHVVLLRGNHECSSINRVYGFYDECKRRYNLKLWRAFCCVFDCLPIACVIAERIFCVHGGLSPSLHRMEQLLCVRRPLTVGDCGMVCDLLWSDPDPDVSGWAESGRGVSYQFGPSVIDAFLEKHDFDLIVRAHQVVEDGYEFFHGRKLVTVFSAPNYCNEFDNLAAMMVIDAQLHCSFLVLAPK